MRRILIDIAKLVISGVLIWLAFRKIDTASAFAWLASIDPGVIVLAVGFLVLQHVVGALRFHHLLACLQHPIRVMKAMDNIFVGFFFSQIFISFIGGDAIRVWLLADERLSATQAFKAVLYDRVIGFVSLILLILLTLPWLFIRMPDTQMRAAILFMVALGIVCTIAFLLMHRLPVRLQHWKPFQLASEISQAALMLARSGTSLLWLVALSFLVQLANVLAIWLLARGLQIDITLLDMLVLVPPVMLLAILPISFAGWGVRESSMAVALGLVGVAAEQSIAISICFGLCMIASGLPGVWTGLGMWRRPKLP